MRIHSVTTAGCAVLLLVLAGCPGGPAREPLELVPVEGTVTLGGDPLVGASVMFGGISVGETDANGHYELAQGDRKGCAVGEHQVVIEKWVMPDGSVYRSDEGISPMDAGATQQLPPKYASTELSELTATVPEGGGKIDFELE
jgi:hypothetical protein